MIDDIKTGIEIIEKISRWTSKVVAGRSGKKERRDAQILAEAGTLLTSMRTLDNAIHAHIGPLLLFDAGWSQERREEIVGQINDFAQKEEIIAAIRRSLRGLQVFMTEADEYDRPLLLALSEHGAQLLRTLSGSYVTPFPDVDALREFAMRIRNARDGADVQQVGETAKETLELLDRKSLAEADEIVGTLRARILGRHPDLPDIDWRI